MHQPRRMELPAQNLIIHHHPGPRAYYIPASPFTSVWQTHVSSPFSYSSSLSTVSSIVLIVSPTLHLPALILNIPFSWDINLTCLHIHVCSSARLTLCSVEDSKGQKWHRGSFLMTWDSLPLGPIPRTLCHIPSIGFYTTWSNPQV